MASHAQLHDDVTSLLRQHGSFLDQRQMTMLASMTLSETIVFDRWRNYLELGKNALRQAGRGAVSAGLAMTASMFQQSTVR